MCCQVRAADVDVFNPLAANGGQQPLAPHGFVACRQGSSELLRLRHAEDAIPITLEGAAHGFFTSHFTPHPGRCLSSQDSRACMLVLNLPFPSSHPLMGPPEKYLGHASVRLLLQVAVVVLADFVVKAGCFVWSW